MHAYMLSNKTGSGNIVRLFLHSVSRDKAALKTSVLGVRMWTPAHAESAIAIWVLFLVHILC